MTTLPTKVDTEKNKKEQMKCNQWRIKDFPEEGALTPKGGRQPIVWPIFPENCMKMKKFGARGGGRASLTPPLRSTTGNVNKLLTIHEMCDYYCGIHCSLLVTCIVY